MFEQYTHGVLWLFLLLPPTFLEMEVSNMLRTYLQMSAGGSLRSDGWAISSRNSSEILQGSPLTMHVSAEFGLGHSVRLL